MVSSVEATLGTVSVTDLQVEEWFADLCRRRPDSRQDMLKQAFDLARAASAGKTRLDDGDAFVHICAVADILADLQMDSEVLAAALLHNLLDEGDAGPLGLSALGRDFGPGVARIVASAAKMRFMHDLPRLSDMRARAGKAGTKQSAAQQTESLRKMLLAVVEDFRTVFIKLAERLHDMRMLRYLPEEEQRAVAQETLEIFAPLANRLGIWQIKWELEDLCMRYLRPDTYQQIAKLLDDRRVDRQRYVDNIIATLQAELEQVGVHGEIYGRAKHIYSIWRKMQRKQVGFHQVFDVLAVRVLVDSVGQCYSVLGIVHSLWQPIPNEFDDYIARPKNNNYRSLHTAVAGPDGKIFEVQIRTHEMHKHAELGVASHWKYKEGGKQDAAFEEKIAWMRQLLEPREGEEGGEADFLDRYKGEMFEDRVYVLSPQGQIFDLPQGSTPLDFAYAIHTSLGHRCRGAKIGGRIAPLTQALKTGDQVEILTSKQEHPSRHWLDPGYLKSSRARGKVRQWLNLQSRADNLALGRSTVEQEVRRLNPADFSWEQLAQRLHYASVDDMLVAVGRGDVNMEAVDNAIREQILPVLPAKEEVPLKTAQHEGGTGAVQVDGLDGLLTHTAKCCRPLPDDPVIGYITREKGIAIHRQDCPNVQRWREENNERLIEVEWSRRAAQLYPVEIQVGAYDRTGLLRDVSQALSDEKINITAVQTLTGKDQIANMRLTLEVRDVDQLSRVLDRIEKLPNVFEVRRRRT